ncbi:AraC-type DNA-binding protein [Paenibacillus uliginis N3/975]|uniref:AraC-type DNA-binding protein n=1 Tax=Paenibacillus uliginis N3/975 TaxID=1313296 RepID=A0A1X7HFX9_9BACL|nr:AraC family transcriptional regulator [Paenibacillus uliginis]SMF85970.1 AraC-type DNA-binding protein [Paenibacillus uliginis N3/975]
MNEQIYRLVEAFELALNKESSPYEKQITQSTIIVIASGISKIYCNQDKEETLIYGNIFFTKKDSYIRIEPIMATDVVLYIITFQMYELITSPFDELLYRKSEHNLPSIGLIQSHIPESYMKAAGDLASELEVLSPIQQQLALLELLCPVLTGKELPDTNVVLDEAIAYIHKSYTTSLNRNDLAARIGYHPNYFSRVFREKTGKSFQDYVKDLRIHKAKELLLISSMSISEVARATGFKDSLYFSRVFYEETGERPSMYRTSSKRIVAIGFAETLLAIGIRPVAIDEMSWKKSPYLQRYFSKQEVFDNADLDAIRRSKPDIIVCPAHIRRRQLLEYESISLVLAKPWLEPDPLTQIREFGELFRREQEAENWIIYLYSIADQYKKRLKEKGIAQQSFACYEIAYGKCHVLDLLSRGTFVAYQMLGLQPPEQIRKDVINQNKPLVINMKELPDYTADTMLITIYEEMGNTVNQNILHSDSWKAAEQSSQHRMLYPPYDQIRPNSGISLETQLHTIAGLLLADL